MESKQANRSTHRNSKAKHNDTDAVQRRRAKVRISQKAFRERKKVAAVAQERTINIMTKTLLDLSDTILRSQTHERDESVMRKLHETIEVFISLGADTERRGDGIDSPQPVSEDVGHNQKIHATSTSGSSLLPKESNGAATQRRMSPLMPTLTISPDRTMTDIAAAHPFAIRLIQTTLIIAHASLTGKLGFSTEIAMRLFRYAFLYHSRDEILGKIEWFLRSGQRDIMHLWDVSFIDSAVAQTASAELLESEHHYELLPVVDTHAFERPPSGEIQTGDGTFWNALEVESYLMKNGARFLSPDVIELYLPPAEPVMEGNAVPITRSIAPERSRPYIQNETSDFFSFDALLPGLRATQGGDMNSVTSQTFDPALQVPSQRLVVEASTLFQNLVNISLCMAKGPAYQGRQIRAAVMSSAMQSARVPIASAA